MYVQDIHYYSTQISHRHNFTKRYTTSPSSPGSSVQFRPSVVSNSLRPMDCSMLGFPSFTNSRSLLRLKSIESVMPSNHLILCHPLLLPSISPSIRVFSIESVLRIRWPKYMDCIVHGILQARILEWVAFPFFRDLPNPGIKPRSPTLLVDFYQLSHQGSPRILEWVAYPFSSGSFQTRN